MVKKSVIGLVVLLLLVGLFSYGGRGHHISLEVRVSEDIAVVRHALARVASKREIPVTREFMEHILEDNTDALPRDITDVVVYSEGSLAEGNGYFSADFILHRSETVILLVEAEDGTRYFSYLNQLPTGQNERRTFPVLVMSAEAGTDAFSGTTDEIEVQLEAVSYVNEHHRTFR